MERSIAQRAGAVFELAGSIRRRSGGVAAAAAAKLDRLARSTAHLLKVVETIEAKGVTLRILDLSIDTSTVTGRMLLTMIGAIAQFERELMLERQREGIAKAKAAGKYKGRAPTARAKLDQVQALKAQGVGATEIARRLGIGRASVYRLFGSAA